MNLKDYINNLNKFAEEHPEALEMDVVYAKDDEGNAYHDVYHEPSLMMLDKGYYRDVVLDADDEEFDPNCVCIN